MKASLAFFMSLTAVFLGTLGFLNISSKPKSAVLSARVQSSSSPSLFPITSLEPSNNPILAVLESATPTDEPSSSPSVSPSPTLTPKPKAPSPSLVPSPTPKLVVSPSPSPSPSLIPTITPSPTATPDVYSPASMTPIFAKYAAQYNVDQNEMERIANCESHFNPNAVNGIYAGMFQYSASRWVSERSQMGLDTSSNLRSDIEESIKTAAFTISKDGTSPWPNCLR